MEPIGDQRGDLQAAVVASVIANVFRDEKRRREPFSPADFMPRFDEMGTETHEGQNPDEQLAIVELLNAAFGGKDLRSRPARPRRSGVTTGRKR